MRLSLGGLLDIGQYYSHLNFGPFVSLILVLNFTPNIEELHRVRSKSGMGEG